MTYRYVKQSNNTVEHINVIRQQFPNTSIPEGGDVSHLGYVLLITTQKPDALPWHTVVEAAPVNNVQTWQQVPMTTPEIQAVFVAAMEAHFDSKAQEKKYDNRLTCALRAGYAGPFQAEGQAFAVWMDTCNAYGYSEMEKVLAGQRPMPTPDELIAEFPVLTW
jgi:hypothetical protein